MKPKPIARPPGPRRVPRRMVKTLHARAATREEDFEEYESESEPNMKLSHAFVVVLVLHILAVGGVFAFNTLKSRHISPAQSKPAPVEQTSSSTPEVVSSASAAQMTSAPVPADKPVTKTRTVETDGATHTVVAGDTLTRIATAHKTSVEALEQANNLADNAAIRVGQVLKIPGKSDASSEKAAVKPVPTTAKTAEAKPAPVAKTTEAPATPKTAAAPAPKEESSSSEKTYTVAKGDNPYSIAKKMKVSYNDLIKANNIQDPTKLQIGQKLIIP